VPEGFLASGIKAGIKKSGNPDLALLYSEVPAVAAAAFTTNRFQASPVKVSKLHNLPIVLQHREFVMDLIKSSQDGDLVRDDFPAKQIADMLISILMSVVFNWLRDETKSTKNLSRMSDFVLDMFLNGAGKHK